MTELAALLAACRADPGDRTARAALRDRVEDDDGDTPTRDAVARLCCERCGCPDADQPMHRDRFGKWHTDDAVHAMNSTDGAYLFGDDYSWPMVLDCRLAFYHWRRWFLVCPGCRRKLIAARAHATRRANAPDPADAPGSLFAGAD